MSWGKWFLTFLMVLCWVPGIRGFARAEETRLMIVTDPHYLSPSCYQESKGLFQSAIAQADGKMTQYSAELLQALIEEARHQRPDALIVTGDLTFNGEKVSHEELAAAFHALEAEGIPVWVIPGNHDINNANSRLFTGYTYENTPQVTTAEFGEIDRDFLGEYRWEKGQFSYVVPLRDDLWLVMCDMSLYDPTPATAGYYSKGHQEWLKEVLAEAKSAGACVITATHQSVIPHTRILRDSMTVFGWEKMATEIRESGAGVLNLSGHLHLQHISEQDGMVDIATGSYAVPPFRYGMLEVGEDGIARYEAKALCAEHLPEEINELAKSWFENITIGKIRKELAKLEIPEARMETMLAYAGRLNHAYFSGEMNGLDPSWTEDPAYQMWKEISGQLSFAAYLTGIPIDPLNQRDALRIELSVRPGEE